MEEIGPKTDSNNGKQDTRTDTNSTPPSDNPSNPGGSSDTKQITEGGESDKNEQTPTAGVSE